MGLFANIRRNKTDFDDFDDWLLEPQEDDESFDVPLPGPPSASGSIPPPPAVPVPSPQVEAAAWHLPDLHPTPSVAPSHDVAPPPEVDQGLLVAPDGRASLTSAPSSPDFDEPESPVYQPIDFGASPLWSTSSAETVPAWDAISWVPEPSPEAPHGGPGGSEAVVMLEILGLFPGASWAEVRDAHRELIEGHRVDAFCDPAHLHLAADIRREMHIAYAALRLMAASH